LLDHDAPNVVRSLFARPANNHVLQQKQLSV